MRHGNNGSWFIGFGPRRSQKFKRYKMFPGCDGPLASGSGEEGRTGCRLMLTGHTSDSRTIHSTVCGLVQCFVAAVLWLRAADSMLLEFML